LQARRENALLVATPAWSATISCGLVVVWLDDINRTNAELMNVLLQHKESGLYLKEVGVVTRDRVEAKDFLSSTQAIEFCAAHKVTGMQIVLRFDEQHFDIVLPMTANHRQSQSRSAHAS
jgi:hypothetical protein